MSGYAGGYAISAPSEAQLSATYAPLDNTPTVEELAFTRQFEADITTTVSRGLFVAPFPLEVVALSLCSYGATVNTSAVNFWTVQIRRGTPDGASVTFDVFASKTTNSGGTATQGQDWNFDLVTFDAAKRVFAKGDVCSMVFTVTGSPPPWVQLLVAARYRPL